MLDHGHVSKTLPTIITMFARSFVLALLLSVASAQKALITFTAARNEKLAVYFGAPDIFPPPTHRKCIDWGASLLSRNRTKRRSPHWRPLVAKQQHPDLRCYVSLISCHLSPAPPRARTCSGVDGGGAR